MKQQSNQKIDGLACFTEVFQQKVQAFNNISSIYGNSLFSLSCSLIEHCIIYMIIAVMSGTMVQL